MLGYGFSKEVEMTFDKAVDVVTEELKTEGFGVLITIDVKEKFKEKLGLDFKKYMILGACNPGLAHKAIQVEEHIGLMLPCNVIVFEKEKKSVISIIKPVEAMKGVDNENPQYHVDIREDKYKQGMFALIAAGDSMFPFIMPGDELVFDPNKEPVNGNIVCAMLTGDAEGCTIKIYNESRNTVMLAPYNKEYESMILSKQDGCFDFNGSKVGLMIKGVLVHLHRKNLSTT
ncbi:DUF302 domain-containing protein [Planctomycetota bacterium]